MDYSLVSDLYSTKMGIYTYLKVQMVKYFTSFTPPKKASPGTGETAAI